MVIDVLDFFVGIKLLLGNLQDHLRSDRSELVIIHIVRSRKKLVGELYVILSADLVNCP